MYTEPELEQNRRLSRHREDKLQTLMTRSILRAFQVLRVLGTVGLRAATPATVEGQEFLCMRGLRMARMAMVKG